MQSIAIVGNGVLSDYTGMADAIDSCSVVIRMNRAVFKENFDHCADKLGTKTTIYVHNCWCELEPTFWLPKRTAIWLTVPTDSKYLAKDERNCAQTFKDAGFRSVYQFTDRDIKELHEDYGLINPTTGMKAIWHAVQLGWIPTIFNFSQDEDLKHLYDKETLVPSSCHDVLKEREIVADLVKAGKIVRNRRSGRKSTASNNWSPWSELNRRPLA